MGQTLFGIKSLLLVVWRRKEQCEDLVRTVYAVSVLQKGEASCKSALSSSLASSSHLASPPLPPRDRENHYFALELTSINRRTRHLLSVRRKMITGTFPHPLPYAAIHFFHLQVSSRPPPSGAHSSSNEMWESL